MYSPKKFKNLPISNGQIQMEFDIDFDHLAMIEFGVSLDWEPAQGAEKALFSFTSQDSAKKSEIEALNLSISADKKTMILSFFGEKMKIENLEFSKGKFYHFTLNFFHSFQKISLLINGDKELLFDQLIPEHHSKFKLHSLFLGLNSKMEQKFPGKLSCFRLWNSYIISKSLQALAEWDHLELPPYQKNGFNAIPDTEDLLIAYLKPTQAKLLINDHSTTILGSWVNSNSEYYGGGINQLKIENIADSDHCIYEEARYISIIKQPNHKYLITDRGICLQLVERKKEYFLFRSKDGSSQCKIKDLTTLQRLPNRKGGERLLTIKRISLFDAQNIDIPDGHYNIPKSEMVSEEGTNYGNLFLHRLPQLDHMYRGVDVTEINLFKISNEGIKSPIFRSPSNISREVKVDQGFGLPFGILYVPRSEHHSTSHSTFVTSKSTLEKTSMRGNSWKSTSNYGFSEGISIPGYGGGGMDMKLGYSTELNSSLNNRLVEMAEKQEFYSIMNWTSISHDLVLNKHNLIFDGQFTKYDQDFSMDPSSRFFSDLFFLKTGSKEDFQEFIDKYGTHFVTSARYGAKGERKHTFNQSVIQKLLESGSTIGHKSGYSMEMSGSANFLNMFNIGGSYQESTERENNTAKSISDDVVNLTKEEDTTENSYGTMSEGGTPDPFGAVQLQRNLMPITDLLVPPFTQDLELIQDVRPKLINAINEYLKMRKNDGWIEDPYFLEIGLGSAAQRVVIDLWTNKHFNDLFNSVLILRQGLIINTYRNTPPQKTTFIQDMDDALSRIAVLQYEISNGKTTEKGWFYSYYHRDPRTVVKVVRKEKACKFLQSGKKTGDLTFTIKARWRLCFKYDLLDSNQSANINADPHSYYTPYQQIKFNLNDIKSGHSNSPNGYYFFSNDKKMVAKAFLPGLEIIQVPCQVNVSERSFDQFISP